MLPNRLLNFKRFQTIVKALDQGNVDQALALFDEGMSSSQEYQTNVCLKEPDQLIALYVMEALLKDTGYYKEAEQLREQGDSQRSFSLIREPNRGSGVNGDTDCRLI